MSLKYVVIGMDLAVAYDIVIVKNMTIEENVISIIVGNGLIIAMV